jgi:hypothetical protein
MTCMRLLTKRPSAIGVAAVIALAAPAHADDQGYLSYLASHGVPAWPAGPGIKAGHDACNALRDGSSPESFISTMGAMGALYGQTVVDGAHQFLCPQV